MPANRILAYLAVHVHGGHGAVALSPQDMASHERGYPALRDLAGAGPIGGLVFAEDAVAGDIWSADGRARLERLVIVGPSIKVLTPRPAPSVVAAPTFDRQVRMFGDAGQAVLSSTKVGIIGVGGMGMLLTEYLARVGVGHLVLIDPDRVDPTNLPRLPGARRSDARMPFQGPRWPERVRSFGGTMATRKVDVARRLIREARAGTVVDGIFDDVREPAVAARLRSCDYLFLAADSDQARHLFNALVNQYLIPGAQLGAKVRANKETGEVVAIHSVARTVFPGSGCLWCNQVISPSRMAEESASVDQRRVQRYVDEPGIVAPSVITLNATAAALAANDFLHSITGLTDPAAPLDYARFGPIERDMSFDRPRIDPRCAECSTDGRFGLGDRGPRLPTFVRD